MPRLGPDRARVEEAGEHVAQKWILTRGRDNIRDLLPGPILPPVIDKELLVDAEKELGLSLRPYQEAREWLRDAFWERVHREFGISLGKSRVMPLEGAPADYLASLDLLHPYGDYFAINVSSPNTPGLRALQAREPIEDLCKRVLAARSRTAPDPNRMPPLLVKVGTVGDPDHDSALVT